MIEGIQNRGMTRGRTIDWIQKRGMTRGRKGLGLHHSLLVHQGDPVGSSPTSLTGLREKLEGDKLTEAGKENREKMRIE